MSQKKWEWKPDANVAMANVIAATKLDGTSIDREELAKLGTWK
jgi:hypothetical protein